jgi:Zn-dependent protease
MHKETKRIIIQITLFIATFISTTIAGVEWAYNKSIYMMDENGIGFNSSYSWSDFYDGLQFSVPLLLILTVHEFGHYFTAMYHKVKASLPYYIPIPPIPFLPLSIGTMGAVIRLRSKPTSNLQNFDIGLAGPLAGFIVAVMVMIYGFSTLPPAEYVFQFHP